MDVITGQPLYEHEDSQSQARMHKHKHGHSKHKVLETHSWGSVKCNKRQTTGSQTPRETERERKKAGSCSPDESQRALLLQGN